MDSVGNTKISTHMVRFFIGNIVDLMKYHDLTVRELILGCSQVEFGVCATKFNACPVIHYRRTCFLRGKIDSERFAQKQSETIQKIMQFQHHPQHAKRLGPPAHGTVGHIDLEKNAAKTCV